MNLNLPVSPQLLPTDILLHIGNFSEPTEVTKLFVNKELRANSETLLQEQFTRTFGKIKTDPNQQPVIPLPESRVITRLLYFTSQPDITKNHNIYRLPSGLLERWKWLVEVENRLDKTAQENYDRNISLLENTQATSIIQLQNQLKAFWHADRQLKDYNRFRTQEIAKATNSLIRKIFFALVKFVFSLFCHSSSISLGEALIRRSCETYATIGGFTLNNKDYEVVAFHIHSDEATLYNTVYKDLTHLHFNTINHYFTDIGIFEKDEPRNKSFLQSLTTRQFKVSLGREISNMPESRVPFGNSDNSNVNKGIFLGAVPHNELLFLHASILDEITAIKKESPHLFKCRISSEVSKRAGIDKVLKNKRHILYCKNSFASLLNPEENLIFDPKITQIMIEITMQNHAIISLREDSCEFMNFNSRRIKFKTENFTEENVPSSNGTFESWSDIIQREPILRPGAGVLPEYWVTKPNIVDA